MLRLCGFTLNYLTCAHLWPCHRDFEIVPKHLVNHQNTFGYPQLRIFRLGLRCLRPKLTSLHHFESRLFSQNRMFSVQNEWDLATFWGAFLNFAELWARVLEKKSFSRKNKPATQFLSIFVMDSESLKQIVRAVLSKQFRKIDDVESGEFFLAKNARLAGSNIIFKNVGILSGIIF